MSRGGELFKTMSVTVLGSGFAPFASGSWGSLAAAGLLALLVAATNALQLPRAAFEGAVVAGILIACVLSVSFGEWAIARFGRKDPKPFVLDEFAGQWLAMLLMPAPPALGVGWLAVLGGQFFLFRLFDVWKPTPGRQLERLPAGWGILCDDLSSAIYANLVGQALWRFVPALSSWLAANV